MGELGANEGERVGLGVGVLVVGNKVGAEERMVGAKGHVLSVLDEGDRVAEGARVAELASVLMDSSLGLPAHGPRLDSSYAPVQ